MNRLADRLKEIIRSVALHIHYSLRNIIVKRAVCGSAPYMVSMTTYGKRLKTAHLALESIAAGHLRPQRLVLWVDRHTPETEITPQLSRLQRRGLEIRRITDYGPHKKYYAAAQAVLQSDLDGLVTVDDDVFYPLTWLQELVEFATRSDDKQVICQRAHRIPPFQGENLPAYRTWDRCTTAEPSFRNFATGVSGILYRKAVLNDIVRAGTGFLECAPHADDVWLHFIEVKNGHRITQCTNSPKEYINICGTHEGSLATKNVDGQGNDTQIQSTYSEEAIDAIRND